MIVFARTVKIMSNGTHIHTAFRLSSRSRRLLRFTKIMHIFWIDLTKLPQTLKTYSVNQSKHCNGSNMVSKVPLFLAALFLHRCKVTLS